MAFYQEILILRPSGAGMREFTDSVAEIVARSGLRRGLVSIFCHHTSCSLVIMENAEPGARHDLERWLDRLIPAEDPLFTHTQEGPDDMPSHIKMALTRMALR